MNRLTYSKKGQELIDLYKQMVDEGYVRDDQLHVEQVFSDFELRPYRADIKRVLEQFSVSSVLDYGAGASDWHREGFDEATGQSAVQYFNLQQLYRYEPARDLDERQLVDCVVCFDVLEHIFVSDVAAVVRDLFSCASKLLVINVACYAAAARLPNGENAHVTVRHPLWWKGVIDCISLEFPDVAVFLIASTGWRQSRAFELWNANMWQRSDTFVTTL